MKKFLSVIIIAAMVLTLAACGAKNEKNDTGAPAEKEGFAGMANPMAESTPEEIFEKLGVRFRVPEGVEDAKYFIINGKTAEMQFTNEGTNYCARIEKAEEFTDISGMNYEWTRTDNYEIDSAVAKISTVHGDDEAGVCLWYIEDAKLMYSVSATGKISSGGMIFNMANDVYEATNGRAE